MATLHAATKAVPLHLSQLARLFSTGGRELLEDVFPEGAGFVIRPNSGDDHQALFDTPPDGTLLEPETRRWDSDMHETQSSDDLLRWAGFDADSPVVPVVKSDRNPFMGVITVGRAGNNDIRLGSPCVSKLHAFIKKTGDGWKVLDSNSSNKTFVNHIELQPQVDYFLRSGDELRFGDVTGTFFDIAGLQALCQISNF